MIEVIAKYPWGEKSIFYDSWIIIWAYEEKDKNGEWKRSSVSQAPARTQEEYKALLDIFEREKYTLSNLREFKYQEYNTHYVEAFTNDSKAICYIQGFLSNNQN